MAAAREVDRTGSTLLRVRAAVIVTAVVAVLSVLTGVVNISPAEISGPLAPYVPRTAARAAGFTGTMTGFLMLVSTWGLRSGYRVAWYATVLLLPVTAIQGLIQTSILSVPLVVLSVLAMPTVLANRRYFQRSLELGVAQLASLAAVLGVQVYGTVGAYALREDFDGVETVLDAFYFTIVTASTVGYGDVTPSTQVARLFAMSVVLTGVASFGVAIGTLLGPLIEHRLATALGTMSDNRLELLDDHYVVVGYGDLTEPIIENLGDPDTVVVTRDADRAVELQDAHCEVVVGDPSDEEPLLRAKVDRARALIVATNDDAQDAMSILTARELNPSLRIVAAATDRENVRKLKRAGADVVLSPAVLGGRLLVQSARGDDEPERALEAVLAEGREEE